MLPEISLGPVNLYTFGILGSMGFWVAGWVMQRRLRELGRPGEWGWEIVLCGLIGGVFGASIDWALQNNAPIEDALIGTFTGGGLVWLGGAVGGLALGTAWCFWRNYFTWEAYGVATFAFLSVQFFGRLGCHFAGDGDYGVPWDGPWAIGYPDGVVPTPPGVLVHPTPLYEAFGLALFFLLLWRLRFRLTSKEIFASWLLSIFIIRFPVEFIRTNPEVFLDLTVAQLLSTFALLAGVAIWISALFERKNTSKNKQMTLGKSR